MFWSHDRVRISDGAAAAAGIIPRLMTDPPEPRRRSFLRRWPGRLILLLCAMIAAVGLAEIALRIAGIGIPHPRTWVGELENAEPKNFAWDAALGWRMPRGTRFTQKEAGRDVLYVADENGFRVDPDRRAASGGITRHLVAAGDSFTFGTGVPAAASFPAVLADLLGGWKVTNVAQPGYAVDQIWQTVVREAIPRAPDLIVAGIYPEDLERSLSAFRLHMNKPTFLLKSGRLVPMTAADRPGALARFLDAHSRLFTLARQASVNAGYRFGAGEMWHLNTAMFDEMTRACRDAGITLVFVHIPPMTMDEFPALVEYMRRTGAPFVDALPAMKAQGASLYLEGNMHLNEAGHVLVAELIAEFLRENPGLLRRRTESSATPR